MTLISGSSNVFQKCQQEFFRSKNFFFFGKFISEELFFILMKRNPCSIDMSLFLFFFFKLKTI